MPTFEERKSFAEKFLTDREGRPFSFDGRPWLEEYWRALDGFKTWRAGDQVCNECKPKLNQIIDRPGAIGDKCTNAHCDGITAEPIILSALCLPRQEGKTTAAAGYALSHIFLEKNKSVVYIASSEEQARAIVEDNFFKPIQNSPTLRKMSKIVGGKITVPHMNSQFEAIRSSFASATGRSRSLILADESRDLAARTVLSLAPSVFAARGVNCDACGYNAEVKTDPGSACPVCGDVLIPWYGRICAMSSAGISEGGEKDWFRELVEKLTLEPDKNCHVLRFDERTNPNENTAATETIGRVFGSLDSTKHYADVEVNNIFATKGEDFVSRAEIEACVDKRLQNRPGSDRPVVGFLDTSITHDLTSIVIASSDESGLDDWDNLTVDHIKVWDPQKMDGKVIDTEEVFQYLGDIIPMFPNLKDFRIDTRGMPWAIKMTRRIKKDTTWGKRVSGFNGGKHERSAAWALLEQRIKAKTLRIPRNDTLIKEILGVRRLVNLNNEIEIRDRDRKRRHSDVSDGLSYCCLFAHMQQIKSKMSLAEMQRKSTATSLLDKLREDRIERFNPNSF